MIDKDWVSSYSHLNLIGHVIEGFHRLFRVFHLKRQMLESIFVESTFVLR